MIAMLKNLKSFISESVKSASKTQKVMLMIAGGLLLITALLILAISWSNLISNIGAGQLTAQVANNPPSSGCLAPYVDLGYLTLGGGVDLAVGRYYNDDLGHRDPSFANYVDYNYVGSRRHLPSLLNDIYLTIPTNWYRATYPNPVLYPCETTDYVGIANSLSYLTYNNTSLFLDNISIGDAEYNGYEIFLNNYYNEPGWSDVFAENVFWDTDNPTLYSFNLLQSALASAYPNAQNRMIAEDALINSIAVSGKITIDLKTATTPQTVVKSLDIPMSNCALISGTGPRKVVFTRNGRWNSNVNVFLLLINNVIEEYRHSKNI